jgi:hypothetical protein
MWFDYYFYIPSIYMTSRGQEEEETRRERRREGEESTDGR